MRKLAVVCAIGALGLSVGQLLDEHLGTLDLDDGREVRAKSDVRQLMMLVGMYEADRGDWPRGVEGWTWHEVLVFEGYLPAELIVDGWWRDPWGNPYVFADADEPGRVLSVACQTASVVSFGRDGVRSGDDVVLE